MYKLYANGDSHTAFCYPPQHKQPTSTQLLAQRHGMEYENQAWAGVSNQRIVRTTLESLPRLDPKTTVVCIGWSSFERTEWYFDNQWMPICGPMYLSQHPGLIELSDQHRKSWDENQSKEQYFKMQQQHHVIWCLHLVLQNLGFQHIFWQGCDTAFFDGCPEQDLPMKLPWPDGVWAHNPYVEISTDGTRNTMNFSKYVQQHGCEYTDNFAHFGSDAQLLWADYVDPFLTAKLNLLSASQA